MTGSLLAAGALLFFSPQVMEAASGAAAVFCSGVLPALFPMMVLNGLAAALPEKRDPAPRRIALLSIAFAFAAGSPASAQRLKAFHERNPLPLPALCGLAGATGVMSPLFIAGSLARGMASPQAAWLMLTAHWGAALLTGTTAYLFLQKAPASSFGPRMRGPIKGQGQSPCQGHRGETPIVPPVSLASALPGAISSAAQALLAVCGAMMLFSVAAAVLRAALTLAFPAWAAESGRALAVLWALTEIGGGAFAVLDAFPAPPLPLLCALCSFGGLSIWLQNLLFLGKAIRPVCLLLLRGLHGAFSYGLCVALLRLLPDVATAAATGGGSDPAAVLSPAFPPTVPALLLLCLLARPRPAPALP